MSKVTNAIHAAVLKLEALAVKLADFTHDLHGSALQHAYNKVATEASLLREQLRTLGADTRDAVIDEKVKFQQAIKDAEAAFNAEIKRLTDAHTTQRAVISDALGVSTEAAIEAHNAITDHDAARPV